LSGRSILRGQHVACCPADCCQRPGVQPAPRESFLTPSHSQEEHTEPPCIYGVTNILGWSAPTEGIGRRTDRAQQRKQPVKDRTGTWKAADHIPNTPQCKERPSGPGSARAIADPALDNLAPAVIFRQCSRFRPRPRTAGSWSFIESLPIVPKAAVTQAGHTTPARPFGRFRGTRCQAGEQYWASSTTSGKNGGDASDMSSGAKLRFGKRFADTNLNCS